MMHDVEGKRNEQEEEDGMLFGGGGSRGSGGGDGERQRCQTFMLIFVATLS